ncbi:ATP-binding cassette domain-containing protein [Campylobacter jejuni]|nr:ATP-binding cassette domain-containing protein [Campylobacter jejuni]MCW1358572.1 ATP-binding cassette domain-containing protein [Campylobacter jejuni]HDZ4931423.1 ABC transporter ATP-binding protein [Campylobacter jejuni]HDZ4940494.1 ABC transporter ATP-binding protein [Campylobacter jejuni]HDZ4943383.1 ABC transporter ATP-binding protein [Campylobacter jejuni]
MKIRNLNISLKNNVLLKNINLDIKTGKTLMILGESGVGKSLLGKALVRLLDSNFTISFDELSFHDFCIFNFNKEQLREFRSKVALVLQDAELSLYPYLDIGNLCHLVLKTHTKLKQKERKDYAFSYLYKLGFEDLDRLWHSYVNELSLGMARRVSLALALLNKPQILICDEITASLDKENVSKIISILEELKNTTALVCITHDLNLVNSLADEILMLEKSDSNLYDLDEFLRYFHA